jgi:NAD(P)-dependent dehydrogenase (short-subunit alcohol dehydrogenase family)
MKTLQGKIALITGASRGVSASIVEKLAERGADVVINFRSKRPRAEAVNAARDPVLESGATVRVGRN